MKLCAEKLLNDKTEYHVILEWFNDNDPITGTGYKYYANAAAHIIQDPVRLSYIVKSAWRFGDFTHDEQKLYFNKFKRYLIDEDHIQKIDNHLWKENINAAKNSLYYVNEGYQKSFNAQISLIQNHKNAFKLFKSIPKQFYTSGLIYRYLLWSKKSKIPSGSEIVELSKIAAVDKCRANNFWKIQSYFAREFIEQKKYSQAYRVANSYFTSSSVYKSEAEYLSGWIALNFLRKPDLALKHFRNFNRIVKTPISRSRGIYWLARAYEDRSDLIKSKKLYYLAATKYPYTFYGQIAALELKQDYLIISDTIELPQYTQNINKYINNNELTRGAWIISQYGGQILSRIYINSAMKQAHNISEVYCVVKAIARLNNLHYSAWAAKHAMQKHVLIKNYAFPTPYTFSKVLVEIPLIYSIIRQESVFDQYAISSAQAMGLMQIMKSTACDIAKNIGIKCRLSKLTTSSNYNICLGSDYINQMILRYQGSYLLAIASYNCGIHNVDKWLKIYGDPRKSKNHREVLNWIEHIPFYETRNYVQRVLENLHIYRSILDTHKQQFRLLNDLLHNMK